MQRARRDWHEILVIGAAYGAVALGTVGCTKDPVVPAAIAPPVGAASQTDSVELTDAQLKALKLAVLGTQRFKIEDFAVGSIDFDENAEVQVFSPYAGRIIEARTDIGDEVRRGATLYTVDSPDLLQAESTLITDAGQHDLAAAALARAKDLYEHEGLAQKDYQQALSDEMSAAGALSAARAAVRIFGKSELEINAIIAKRSVDATLVIPSPVSGRVVARAAQPGLLVQPGNAPAPYTVADLSTYWMLANVAENQTVQLRTGQAVHVKIAALGDREFQGTVTAISPTIDPTTHTAVVRSTVHDPEHQLRPGMMATFAIETATPVESVAIPVKGVVREGDGTMSVWVTTDRRRFIRHTVVVGLEQNGIDQIVSGANAGELAVVEGAIFLSNMLSGSGGDD